MHLTYKGSGVGKSGGKPFTLVHRRYSKEVTLNTGTHKRIRIQKQVLIEIKQI